MFRHRAATAIRAGASDRTRRCKPIQAAVDKLQPGDTCLILGGTYRETVVFPRSGKPGGPLPSNRTKGQKVMVSGCEAVTGWTRHKDNIWKAPMNWTLGLGRNQVFDGSGVMIEARYPKAPSPGSECMSRICRHSGQRSANFRCLSPRRIPAGS